MPGLRLIIPLENVIDQSIKMTDNKDKAVSKTIGSEFDEKNFKKLDNCKILEYNFGEKQFYLKGNEGTLFSVEDARSWGGEIEIRTHHEKFPSKPSNAIKKGTVIKVSLEMKLPLTKKVSIPEIK